MAAADRTNNTEQLQRFINNLWQHQQKNEFCDFTLTTNNTSIECHKLVLSSASSYFSQLLCDSEHNTNIIDVTPLPEHILRTVVVFMYNSEYVIDYDNVIELLKLSRTWNLDILAKLCVEYIIDNITINNACRFYNFALDNIDQHKSQIINDFIREHFTSLHESGQLRELSLKNFTTIIEHDEINVKNEDVIFSSAVQIINQRTSVEDINRCLELVRFPHMSGDFLVNIVLDHELMKEPPLDKYPREALLYQVNKRSIPEVKPPRYWERSGIYYIGKDQCVYQYVSKAGNNKCVKMMNIPKWVDNGSSVAFHRARVVIVGGLNNYDGEKRALLLDMTNNTEVTQLPDLPEPRWTTDVVLSDNDVYVVGGLTYSGCVSSVYHLSLGSDAWQIKRSMPHAVSCPLVIQHQQCIYVLGGYNENGDMQSSVSQYSIKDDRWKRCRNMPGLYNGDDAGVVVHEGKMKVITVNKCLMYADDTDTWTVKRYNKLGNKVKAFVKRGQICAVASASPGKLELILLLLLIVSLFLHVGAFFLLLFLHTGLHWSLGGTFFGLAHPFGNLRVMMSYDDVNNVWKTEHEEIVNALHRRLFC